MTELLSFEHALAVIDELGFIVADPGLLASALARPGATVFGADAYPDLITKAAALMHSVARNHALLDGNKRTAWTLGKVMLALNGVALLSDDDVDTERFMIQVAVGGFDLETIAKWLTDHTVPQR